jgi:hypothetical protein
MVSGCPGIHRCPGALRFERNLPRVAPMGPFERHVFHEVRQTAQSLWFMAGANAQPNANGR